MGKKHHANNTFASFIAEPVISVSILIIALVILVLAVLEFAEAVKL